MSCMGISVGLDLAGMQLAVDLLLDSSTTLACLEIPRPNRKIVQTGYLFVGKRFCLCSQLSTHFGYGMRCLLYLELGCPQGSSVF
jgi:hypothetical protein